MEEWLRSIGLGERIAAFRAQAIAADDLPALTDADLRELGLTIGERKRFARALEALAGHKPEATRAERRPLTMMFVDMVASSRLSEQLDPEDLMELLQAYRGFCGGVIERFSGHIARVVGDGILAYFCYPVANENDPERAVRAALDIARGIPDLSTPAPGRLAVRIGIATGRVIVSDLFAGGREADRSSIIGATPNLAARLQSLAPPGGVVIGPETHARVGRLFACDDLGELALHGFDTRHRAWRVLGPARVSGPRRLTPLIDRMPERARIAAAWRQAAEGEGRVLLLLGEAGIGKSRLVEDVLAGHPDGGLRTVRFTASAFDQDSALHPSIVLYRNICQLAADDPPEVKRAKLAARIKGSPAQRAQAFGAMARLLDIPLAEARPEDAELTPAEWRERILSVTVEQVCLRAEKHPVCVLAEDLHWLDPTSLELLDRMIAAARGRRIMLLLTARDRFEAAWTGAGHVETLRLSRLAADDVGAMVASLFADAPVPAHIGRLIARKTDGVPLFVEEVACSLLQRPRLPDGDLESLDEPDSGIPASLQEALMARLDRAGAAKDVAQIAAVAGRSVRRAVLEAISPLDAAAMDDALATLVVSGVLFRDDAPSAPGFAFSHALMRDAAYDTLLRERRRGLHLAVARALPAHDPQTASSQPELLALHLSEAGAVDEAARHWEDAARRSLDRSAMAEASRLLRRGIAALRAAEPTPARRHLLLRLKTLLGPALIAVNGAGSAETQAVYDAALALCRELPEDASHFPIYWGLWRISRDTATLEARAATLLQQARSHGDPGLLLEAHHCAWATSYHTGDFRACCDHVEAGLAIYQSGDFAHHARLYANHDSKVCAHGELAQVYWMRGKLRSAAEQEAQSLAHAEQGGHLGSRMHAMGMRLLHRVYRREYPLVFDIAGELAQFATDHALEEYRGKSLIFRGWTVAMRFDPAEGLRLLEDGLAIERDADTPEDFPLYACLHAEALARTGQAARATEMLTAEMRQFAELGLRSWRSELLRTQAEMLLATDPRTDAAAALLEQAARVTADQGVPMLGLRVAITAARLDLRRGDGAAGALRLEAALHLLSEDDGDPEIAQARAMARAWRHGGAALPVAP